MVIHRLLQVRSASEASNLSVIVAETTVLGDLGGRCGIDYAEIWFNDDVWDCGVFGGVAWRVSISSWRGTGKVSK